MSTTTWAAVAVVLLSAGALRADTVYNFQTFNGPSGANAASWGINNLGYVVGYYGAANGNLGFEYNPSTQAYKVFTGPSGANDIQVLGINDNGDVAGSYRDASNVTHGFVDSNGVYKTIDGAGALYGTTVNGINNSGQLSVTYATALFNSAYRFTPLGSGYSFTGLNVGADGTFGGGINNKGTIAGYYQTPNYGGFIWNSDGTFSTFINPNDLGGTTQALDVNDNGVIVGAYFSSTGESGYVDQGGVFTKINVPGSIYTYTTGINNSGEITGWYLDSTDQIHSYVATPVSSAPEPASFAMLGIGGLSLLVWARRRAV